MDLSEDPEAAWPEIGPPADPAEVRVVVVDDQAPFRAAARAVIARAPGFALVGEASDGEEALALVDDVRPGLVLMDIMMPVLDGLAATARLRRSHPEVVVVLVSTYERGALPEGVAAAGAAAYLHKEELSPRVLADLWAAHAPIAGRPT
jgi:two-component system invasion response regulator UvrY